MSKVKGAKEVFPFNQEFQYKILALLMRSKKFMVSYSKYIKPEYFDEIVLKDICESINSYYREYDLLPVGSVLVEYMDGVIKRRRKKKNEYEIIIDKISKVKASKYEESIRDKVKEWALEIQVKQAVITCSDITTGDLDVHKLRIKMEKVFKYDDSDDNERFYFYFDRLEERFAEYRNNVNEGMPLGIEHIDKCLDDGGICKGDLIVILGATNIGKSFVMLHIAKSMMTNGRKVAFFPLESSARKTAQRLDMQIARKTKQELRNDNYNSISDINLYNNVIDGNAVIIPYPTKSMTIYDLKDSIEILKAAYDYHPDVVLIDSGNIMKSTKHQGMDIRHGQASIYEDLKAYGQETGIRIICSDQTNRAGVSKIKVGVEDIGEAYEKAQIATTIVAICQTQKEYRCIDNDTGYMRFFLAKNREETKGIMTLAKIRYDHLGIYSKGIIQYQGEELEDIKITDGVYGTFLNFDYKTGSIIK